MNFMRLFISGQMFTEAEIMYSVEFICGKANEMFKANLLKLQDHTLG